YFRFDGPLLALDRLDLGDLSIGSGVPELPGPIAAVVGGLVAQVEREAEKATRAMFGRNAIEKAFESALAKRSRSLAKGLEAAARGRGLAEIDAVGKLELDDGKLAVTVTGKRLDAPTTASSAVVRAVHSRATGSGKTVIKPIPGLGTGK